MKIIKFIAVWFVSAFILLLLFTAIIPEDESGMITFTAFPTLAVLIIPIACGVLAASKKKKAKEKHSTSRKIKYFLQKKIKESQDKKKYDSLSEAEKWKLERESNASINPTMWQPRAKEQSDSRKSVLDCIPKNVLNDSRSGLDINQIIEDENEWRRVQQGLSETDYELHKVDAMGGHEFEHWCAGLLSKNGYSNVKLTPASGDQGVDILAEKDGILYAIQCKCYSSDLGNTPIQEVNTGRAIYNCHIGAVMTNRYFTKGAKDAAEATGILLWDRDKLKQMM